ncbi:prothymosin alpha-like isoform X2 [Labrus bergylta]|uniref:prothymosin alpha-like isoform X2 n=1 Tax=Labrus bergylta TaxID=56723 RepID=UPI0033141829
MASFLRDSSSRLRGGRGRERRSEDPTSSLQEELQPALQEQESAAANPETSTDPKLPGEEETEAERGETEGAEEARGGESEGEEGQGVKRKREGEQKEEEAGQGSEKKKMDEESMASMLADFVACPPDDEDGASGSNRS